MTHYRQFYDPGSYLGAWHLTEGKDAVVTIERVDGAVLVQGTRKTRKPSLKFTGSRLRLALNKTNGKTIANLYGTSIEGWVGQRIALYIGKTRDPDSGRSDYPCIRVRPRRPSDGATDDAIDETRLAPEPPTEPEHG